MPGSENAVDRFVIACDEAYFKLAFTCGDQPGDLGQVKVPEILRFPNDDGLLFHHIWGKTLMDGDENGFGVLEGMRKQKFALFGALSTTWKRRVTYGWI